MVVARGEVWWARLPGPAGRRPVLVLTRSRAAAVRSSITVAKLTTRVRKLPVEVRLGRADGVPKACVVNLDEVHTIPKAVLEDRVCGLGEVKMFEVDRALRFALGLDRG